MTDRRSIGWQGAAAHTRNRISEEPFGSSAASIVVVLIATPKAVRKGPNDVGPLSQRGLRLSGNVDHSLTNICS